MSQPARSTDEPHSSFIQSVPLPTSSPDGDLRVFVGLNFDWIKYVLGACSQLCADWVWQDATFGDLLNTRAWAMVLLDLFIDAPFGPEFPIQFRIEADGTLQFSLDDGFSWGDTGFSFGTPPGSFPWPLPPFALETAPGLSLLWREEGGPLVTAE